MPGDTFRTPRMLAPSPKLTLGPVLFNWSPEDWRDFYFRIADEAPLHVVSVGEVVCAKRLPFFAPYLPAVVERLSAAGKEVVLSTLGLVMTERETATIRDLACDSSFLVEANDNAALSLLAGRPHVVGPAINVYTAATLRVLARRGAIREALPCELPAPALRQLAAGDLPLEVQVFGRAPLAISARCYHARIENLHKDGCRFVCEKDPNGLSVDTIEGVPFLAVNGVQTLSHACVSLASHLDDLRAMGIGHFRLSPQWIDMVAAAHVFADSLACRISSKEADARLQPLCGEMPLCDGFYRGLPGATLVGTPAPAP
jgi:collagenase-like PrtC family protease